ncbi:hypothetical protein AB5I41_17345 [Sphingomonas sp. MMS24-JH45]
MTEIGDRQTVVEAELAARLNCESESMGPSAPERSITPFLLNVIMPSPLRSLIFEVKISRLSLPKPLSVSPPKLMPSPLSVSSATESLLKSKAVLPVLSDTSLSMRTFCVIDESPGWCGSPQCWRSRFEVAEQRVTSAGIGVTEAAVLVAEIANLGDDILTLCRER